MNEPRLISPADLATAGGVFSGVTAGADLTVNVAAFNLGNFTFSGGSLSLLPNGTWYVGVDLLSKELIALPRLGHRGWIPLAKSTTNASKVTSLRAIEPQLPASRLPRTTKRLLQGQPLNVVVMGSSLAEGTDVTVWAGMLFNAASAASKYKFPGNITLTNIALGGSPNQFLMAQLGLASRVGAIDYAESNYALTALGKTPPNGRSTLFTGVDLVVMTSLANGGEYRLDNIEVIVRRLREMGIEVILTTDNGQGTSQVGGTGPWIWPGGYNDAVNALLYVDGPEVMRIADLYNCELADTAAYVTEATLRYPTSNIYRDAIHMYGALPNGRTGQPAGGYEVYARAIRSLLSIDNPASVGTVVTTYDFASGTQGWTAYGPQGAVANSSGRLAISKASSTSGQWGGWSPYLTNIRSGDTVRVQGTLDRNGVYTAGNGLQLGLQGWSLGPGNGFGSNTAGLITDGAFDVTLTANRDNSFVQVLFFGNLDAGPSGATVYIDDVTITVNSTFTASPYETIVGRTYEAQRLPPSRVVTDLKMPGDVFVMLPQDEPHLLANDAYKGTLGANPGGSASFARRFSSAVGASADLLTLTTGQRASFAAHGMVSLGMIIYGANGDPSCTFEVYTNSTTLVKTITIPAQTISRESFVRILGTTEINRTNATPDQATYDIRVTSGTLKLCAMAALTMDMDFYPPEAATRIGTWSSGRVTGGPPNMPGYATDTANDYAYFRCPPTGRRVSWACSSKPNSKNITTYSGRTITTGQSTTGVNNLRMYGGHVGPGDLHYIKLEQTQSNTDQATNGYGLHFGYIIVVNDR